jgi:shikimate dehydrogenase
MDKIHRLISNNIDLTRYDFYSAIIGEKPSAGARSPLLWNAAFTACGMSATMLPFDVTESNLHELIRELEKDQKFIGGAVAFPYKSSVADILRRQLTPTANTISAVNCIFRNETGSLAATNTDGEACILSLQNNLPVLDGLTALVLGTGGASKAICAYLAPRLGTNGRLYVAYRNNVFSPRYLDNLRICNMVRYSDLPSLIGSVDLIVNCTLLGGQKYPDQSPLRSDVMHMIKTRCFIYDINYDPPQSPLLKRLSNQGNRCLNGLEMNLLQAVLAFKYACRTEVSNLEDDDLYNIMSNLPTAS